MPQPNSTRIIFVHGLASKPPKDDLLHLWSKALLANLRKDNPDLARSLAADAENVFRLAYWANEIPDHIEDDHYYVRNLEKRVDEVIAERKRLGSKMHIGAGGWIAATTKSMLLSGVDLLARSLTIKDNVIDDNLREVELYGDDQYIADRIRGTLETELNDAWDNGQSVVVISHSMGTFIAYDVLWRYSHRSDPQYARYRKQVVDLFITMGSPLGDETLRQYMLIDRWRKSPKKGTTAPERRRFYPTNVKRWQNYAAYGDVVCHDSTLDDDFFGGMREQIGGFKSRDLRDYTKLYNPFQSTQQKANPHKSYGYLVQPKLSQNLQRFFGVA